ncbi:MAG: RIP metalloprotease RseP [bacterium]|nr:RIP metalloprotease RseP [bacterium]
MIVDIIRFLIGLSVLVFVHELGHFLAAKRAGIKVEEFGIGFPPRIFKKKVGETVYSLNLFPIGGFVRLYGEEEDVQKDVGRAFYHKKPLARAGVVVAGVIMNFLLAVLLFSIVSWMTGVPTGEVSGVIISEVAENSPAKLAGIQAEDKVLSIGGQEIKKSDEFINKVNENRGKEIEIALQNNKGEKRVVKVTPREKNPNKDEGALGVSMVEELILAKPPLRDRPFVSLKEGLRMTREWVLLTIGGLRTILTQVFQGSLPTDVSGPVGIYRIATEAAKYGIVPLLTLWGILSVNLAILNIAPFPALDGGRLVFIIAEAIFGRRVHAKVEHFLNLMGLGLLILFLIWVTKQDVLRILKGV